MLSGRGFTNLEADNTTSNISSDPFQICPCDSNNHPNCIKSSNSINALNLSIYPGETFQVSLVSTGQGNGIVPVEVRSQMDRGNFKVLNMSSKQLNCVLQSTSRVTVELYADGPCSTFGKSNLSTWISS